MEQKQDNNARITGKEGRTTLPTKNIDRLEQLVDKATEFAREKNPRPTSYYTRFLSRAILLEESGPPRAVVSTVGIISLFLFGMITWAAITTLNQTSVARGEVRPASSVQPVQHLEGGIVSNVRVHDGEQVRKGQEILTMAPTPATSNYNRILARHTALSLQINRLKTFAAGEEADFSAYEKSHPLLVQDQKDVLTQQNNSRVAQQQVIMAQLDEKQNELVLLDRQEKTQQNNLAILAEEMKMRKELTEKGLGSKLKLLEIQRSHNQALGDLNQTQARKAGTRASISQVRGNLVALNEKLRNDALIQVDSLSSERAQVTAELTQLRDRVQRLSVIAPVDGIVKGLKYRTIGSVVPPGDVVAEIVPLSDKLVAEVKISPRDIGHVKIGTEVLVKLDTYNFARYGSLSGSLNHVSASSYMDEQGETYFKGVVELPRNYIGTDPASNRITSGMTLVADIQTGKKTLLQYLVKPINNALDTAFRER